MSAISIKDLSKTYDAVEVMRGINIEIEKGEFVVLVGPSGCGKSTLLRMIAGLEEISGGELSIGDKVVNDLSPKDRDIAMVFQTYALYPHMTVLENMGFSLKLAGKSKEDMLEAVTPVAEILGLTDYLERYPRQLSGGQRQRVAMGRAIVRKPAAFLFDEPLSNLDAQLRVAMRTEIKALHQRLKSTIVYVTHDQIEAMTMADRIVVLNAGTVEQIGTPLDLYDEPANRFVAGFIGSPPMNFISARINDDGVTFADNEIYPLTEKIIARTGIDVTLGIRPDRFTLDPDGFSVMVSVVEPTGSETMIHGTKSGDPITIIFKGRPDIKAGEDIRVSVTADALYCFDATTGTRLTSAVDT